MKQLSTWPKNFRIKVECIENPLHLIDYAKRIGITFLENSLEQIFFNVSLT